MSVKNDSIVPLSKKNDAINIAPFSEKLTPQQLQCLQYSIVGKPDVEIATLMNVSRSTVSRWKHSPHFIAEYNLYMNDLRQTALLRLNGLLYNAVSVIEDHVSKGSLKAAVELLKIVGVHGNVPIPDSETDPKQILQKQCGLIALKDTVTGDPLKKEFIEDPKNPIIRAAFGSAQELYKKAKEVHGID